MNDPRRTGKRRRHRLLSPVAFGIHHLVHNDLRDFFERELGHSTFFFFEYFLDQPHTRWDAPQSALHRTNCVTAPFLSRVVDQNRFIPALNVESLKRISTANDIETVPLTRSSLRDYWGDLDTMSIPLADTDVLQVLFREWMGVTHQKRPGLFTPELQVSTHADGIVSAISGLSTQYLKDDYPRSIIERARADGSFQEIALALLREYELVLRPWLRSREIRQVGLVSASISSKCLFWGECLVLCSLPSDVDIKRPPAWMRRLTENMCKWIGSTYIPMLTMLENYIYESELQAILNRPEGFLGSGYRGVGSSWIEANAAALKSIGSGIAEPSQVTITDHADDKADHVFLALLCQCSREPKRWKGGLSKLERSFVELWADRIAIVLSSPESVKESLVFAKYLVASPAMVRRVLQAVSMRHMSEHPESGKRRSVKTALVIGGPGSGKDSMALLIQLFSPGYRLNPPRTLNMAMFRPKEAAVPLLLGLDVQRMSGEGEAKDSLLSFQGLLQRAIEFAAQGRVREADTEEHRRGFTFILDELNSLDIDTQGALLRLLENAELQPLGGMSPREEMDLLVVGVMNEDPQMIMKRRGMERVVREKQLFGGLFGEALYEMLRNQRRLRDDLYYRLIRGGEIHIPELRDRREDIPILFYFMIETEFHNLMPPILRSTWEVELPVYEELMSPSLQWEGNLRELQAATRRIVIEAVEDFEAEDPPPSFLLITGAHARKILQQHYASARFGPQES